MSAKIFTSRSAMEERKRLLQLEFFKDLFKHHRKFTAFQKIAVLTIFLVVIVCIFRNLWILTLAFSYCVCLYCTVLACRYVIQLRSHLPSETILILLESLEHFYENCLDYLSSKTDNSNDQDDGIRANKTESDSKEEEAELEEFFDASEELHPRSQSIFYVDLDSENGMVEENLGKWENRANKLLTFQDCPMTVQTEINKLIVLIKRDFIQSWYNLFSKHFESLEDADEILHEIVINILQRLLKINIKEMAKILMVMFSNHVKCTKEARMTFKVQSKPRRKSSSKSENVSLSPKLQPNVRKSIEECFGAKVHFHTALKSSEFEYLYLNSLVELLILKLVPENLNDSKALVCALREILSLNVLSLVMNLVSDPTFLHEKIIKITSDEEPGLSIENNSAVLIESSSVENEDLKPVLVKVHSDCSVKLKDSHMTKLPQKDENQTGEQHKEQRKSSFLDDAELHFVSKGMCNECNRLCSKDRDKIQPHPHTCALGDVPCFLDVKNRDKDRLSASSGDASPVFNFYISDMDIDRNSCHSEEENSNARDIPGYTNHSPVEFQDKICLQKVPLKLHPKDKDQMGQTKSQTEENGHETSAKSSEAKPQSNLPPKKKDNSVHLSTSQDSTSSETESKFFFRGNFFNFPFPQFGKKPFSEKHRSSSDLESVSDTESEDFSNLRRCKSSTEFGSDGVVSGQEALLYPAEAPLPFQDVHIKKTETAKESGSTNLYTLYMIEYEAIHPTDEGIFVHRSGMVKRRFREFVNLQSRLEDNPLYKKSMRDIKGPRKWLSLPFGNMDKDSIESRRKLLETFITALIKKEDICQGAEMKEFLGYTGDGHIAFVRKVPENIGPRIDQRLVKTMSGMFDKIVEVLPSLPNELPRIIKQEKSRDDSESDKVVEDTDQIELLAEFDEEPARCHRLHKALDDYIKFESLTLQHLHDDDHNTTVGTSVLEWQDGCSESSLTARNQSSDHLVKAQTETDGQCQDAVPLCDSLLDILSELLHGSDNWVCRETVMKTIKTLFGRALERYLHSKIDFLVSEEMDTFYLKILRETVWPNDELSTESRPNYTDGEKEGLKKQAARCLGDFLPGALHTLLGDEDFDLTLDEIMESIKCEKLNRHFWYSFLDILVEHIFPEIKMEEIQRKLSRS